MIVADQLRPGISRADADLLSWAEEQRVDHGGFRSDSVQEYSTRFGIERATALLYKTLLAKGANRAFAEAVQLKHAPLSDIEIIIIPGAFHRDNNDTGADGRFFQGLLEKAGYPVKRLDIPSFGTAETNGHFIAQALAKEDPGRTALVTLSKGSADFRGALTLLPPNWTMSLHAWISFSGLTFGTALVPWLKKQPLRTMGVRLLLWLNGHAFDAAKDISSEGPLAEPFIGAPPRSYHLLAFPLKEHLVHRWAHKAYHRLAPLGPTDGGGILLESALRLPGIVYAVWGCDHYLRPRWDIGPLLVAFANAAIHHAAPRENVGNVTEQSSCK